VSWCLLSPLFCPLKFQLIKADAILSEFGSARGFFLLKREFFSFHCHLVNAQDGRLDHSKVSVRSVGFLSVTTFFELGLYVFIGHVLPVRGFCPGTLASSHCPKTFILG